MAIDFKKVREKKSAMLKYLLGVIALGIVFAIPACAKNTDIVGPNTIDYDAYPDDFMIRLKPDTEYMLKDGDKFTLLSADTHALLKSNKVLKYGDLESDLSRAVYYRKTEPVLIHYNDKDYIWICEENKEGMIVSASFYYVSEYNSLNGDSGQLNMTIGDKILDPGDFVMNKSLNCFGPVSAKVHYEVNELGKPQELENDDEFYYLDEHYTDEVLCLDNAINTWVYENAEATESEVMILPEGTEFRRLRIPKNVEYSFVEGVLEDGRVFRVVEEYWFSEPTAYQAMMDKDGSQFDYHVK